MRKNTVLYAAAAVCLMVSGFLFGFLFSNNNAVLNKPVPLESATASEQESTPPEEAATVSLDKTGTAESDAATEEKITPSTKMVYEYYYMGDGSMEETEEVPPYFLLDMTEEDMRETFIDWDILSFNAEEVIMRKNVEGKSNQYYVVGEHEGYIAVFYETETNGTTLKEITDMPLSAYPEEEQTRLRSGIHVAGNMELIKVLEDYGS